MGTRATGRRSMAWLGGNKRKKNDADRYGILVNCVVDWSTDSVDNPLFLIDIYLHPDASVPFASLHPKFPGRERHVTIAHMAELEEQVPNWAYHATRVFQTNHGRKLYLIPKEPHWNVSDTGFDLDPRHDPIATDEDVRILHKAYKHWLDYTIDFHVSL